MYGPSNTLVARNDDNGTDTNSLISGYIIPAAGTYTIKVLSATGSATGNYTLSLGSE